MAGVLLAAAGLDSGRVRAEPAAPVARRFDFERDTFAYANDLYWRYETPARLVTTSVAPAAPVEFGQRCVSIVRSARQFFLAARFEADADALSEEEYRERVRAVLRSDPRAEEPASEPILIPGHRDLRSFSRSHERLLKSELGRIDSYLQRGNWRMIFPFSRRYERSTVERLLDQLARGRLPVVRIVNFPVIDINHAVLVFDAEPGPDQIRFHAYDPNDVERPVVLVFDRATASFRFPATAYFGGGPVNVYEIFTGLFF